MPLLIDLIIPTWNEIRIRHRMLRTDYIPVIIYSQVFHLFRCHIMVGKCYVRFYIKQLAHLSANIGIKGIKTLPSAFKNGFMSSA